MTEKDDSNDPIEIDMVLELPRILEGPIVLSDGSTLSVGDRVEHATLGTGTTSSTESWDQVCLLISATMLRK